MGLRFNNTHIVEKMEHLPFEELEVTNQVLMFEKRWNDETCRYLDRIFNCVLSEIRHGAVYVFDCNESNARPWIDEDIKRTDEEQEEIDNLYYKDDSKTIIKKLVRGCEIDTERNNNEIAYFLIKDRIFKLGDKEQFIENYRDIEIDFENEKRAYHNSRDFENEMLRKIHKYTFEWGSNYESVQKKFDEKGYHVDYMVIPIGQKTSFACSDDALLITIRHEVDVENRQWLMYKEVFLMSKNGKCTKLNCKFDEFFEFIKEIKIINKKLSEEFNGHLKIANYDIKEFIRDKGSFLTSVMLHFEYPFRSGDIENFYKPIYQAKDMKAYVNSVRWYPSYTIFTKGGEIITSYDLKDTFQMYDHYSVAEAIAKFILNHKKGLSPHDGEFYIQDGVLNEKMESQVIYRDDEGIKYYDWGKNKYYVKIHGFFVPVEENEEYFKPYVEALEERKALVDRLLRAK